MNKKYLISIALVIVVFLTISTFANPADENEDVQTPNTEALEEVNTNNNNNNNNQTQIVENVEEDEEDEEDETPEVADEQIIVQQPVIQRPIIQQPVIQIPQVNPPVVSPTIEVDNSYELALAAVEKTETTYQETDYNVAKALVFHVKQFEKQIELSNRLDNVLEAMKLIDQVYELVVKVTTSTDINELISARIYEKNNDIIAKVENLLDEGLREKLNDKIKDVLNRLKDNESPLIDIEDESIFNEFVKLDIKDDSEYTITLIKDGHELENIENGHIMLDGVYELVVVDNSFNKTSVSFVIDTTPAIINLAGTKGLNKNEYIIDSGDVVTLEDIMAEVVDNIDGTTMIRPYKAHLLISNVASENKYNYDFTNGFETNYHGRYNLYYEYIDAAGNKAEAVMLLVMKDKVAPVITIKGTEGRNNNEFRVNQDSVVTLDDITAISEDNTEGTKTIYPTKITRYYPRETGKPSHKFDATNGFDTSIPGYYIIEYTSSDKAGNKTSKSMLLVVNATKLPKVVDGKTALYSNITLKNEPFFSDVNIEKDTVIEGNGYTVTQNITSEDEFGWYDGGTYPTMGSMFASANGEKITVNNVNFKGTTHTISLGQYRGSSYNNYNTEFNNVNIIGLKVASYSSNIGQAVVVYGNATLNNTKIYGTTRTKLESGPNWPLYDLAVVNYSKTIINGGKIGSIFTWAKARIEIYDAEIDTIFTYMRKVAGDFDEGGLIIGEGSTVNKIIVNNANAVVIIKSGAVVDTLDFNGLNQSKMTITIEPGAIVNNIIK